MILVDIVPFLNPNLLSSSPSLGSHELLQVADGVVFVALHSHLLPQPIIQHHLDHLLASSLSQESKTLGRLRVQREQNAKFLKREILRSFVIYYIFSAA